ncbi:Zinc finger and BTB domain-containing protein 21 [Varanus komodoensis]|nr:Zinc finger and BTB domain-containing protein 21 [Varanus komodoensis]
MTSNSRWMESRRWRQSARANRKERRLKGEGKGVPVQRRRREIMSGCAGMQQFVLTAAFGLEHNGEASSASRLHAQSEPNKMNNFIAAKEDGVFSDSSEQINFDSEDSSCIPEDLSISKQFKVQIKEEPADDGEEEVSESNREPKEMAANKDSGLWPCEKCGKIFTIHKQLERHQELLCSVKPFICHVCNKAFRTNFRLWSHFQSHMAQAAEEPVRKEPEMCASANSPSPPPLPPPPPLPKIQPLEPDSPTGLSETPSATEKLFVPQESDTLFYHAPPLSAITFKRQRLLIHFSKYADIFKFMHKYECVWRGHHSWILSAGINGEAILWRQLCVPVGSLAAEKDWSQRGSCAAIGKVAPPKLRSPTSDTKQTHLKPALTEELLQPLDHFSCPSLYFFQINNVLFQSVIQKRDLPPPRRFYSMTAKFAQDSVNEGECTEAGKSPKDWWSRERGNNHLENRPLSPFVNLEDAREGGKRNSHRAVPLEKAGTAAPCAHSWDCVSAAAAGVPAAYALPGQGSSPFSRQPDSAADKAAGSLEERRLLAGSGGAFKHLEVQAGKV